jgi:ElaB/YqjD/DUF883 family membrane-anchored ribosome-binding protein
MDNTQQQTRRTDIQEQFADDLRAAAEATGQVIESSADDFARSTRQFQEIAAAAANLAEVTGGVLEEQLRIGGQAADKTIRQHPYQALGLAVGVGLLVGYLLKRK